MADINKIKSHYLAVAIVILNTLILLAVANAAAWAILPFLPRHTTKPRNPVVKKYDLEALAKVYPGYAKEQIVALLDETWTEPLQFAPFVQFQERALSGKYVGISTNGFRVGKEQAEWPPAETSLNVFVFGGSTTFGYGVANEETVPSFLQEVLQRKAARKIAVYNFGRAFYYCTQERILFEQLLAAGVRPHLAIFVDGLNEFLYRKNEPQYTGILRRFMNETHATTATSGNSSRFDLGWMPLAQLIQRLMPTRAKESPVAAAETKELELAEFDTKECDQELFKSVIGRWERNRALIEATAARFGVDVAFVWQPVPMYHYDLAQHLFAKGGFGPHAAAHFGYEAMAAYLEEKRFSNVFWAGDLQTDSEKALYVDKVHYTGEMCQKLAHEIGRFIAQRGLEGLSGPIAF